MKGATKFAEAQGGGTVTYACLCGKLMTLYVGEYGTLGPQIFSGGLPTSRPPGIVDPTTGYPGANIGVDGLIEAAVNSATFALLRSLVTREYAISTQAAIREQRELLTAGAGSICASWGVAGDHADLSSGLAAVDGTPGTLTESGATITDPLSVETSVTFVDSAVDDLLSVSLTFSFQADASAIESTRIRVDVILSSLKEDLTGVVFGYCLDPNGGVTSGTTTNRFFTTGDADGFAVEGTSGDWTVGIGVYDGDGEGAIVGYVNSTNEATVPASFDTIVGSTLNIRLGSGTNAASYNGNTLLASTSDWHTDTAWRSGLSSVNGDYAIYVRSPEYDIDSGDTQEFTFYIFTRPAQGAVAGTRVWAYTS